MREAKVAFVAPGQGISSWEDGLDLLEQGPKTASIYKMVHDVTQVNIPEVCSANEPIEDPAVVLPAALGIGVARAEVLQHERNIKPDYLIGVSSGEITVSAISGAIALKEAAELAQKRGQYQQEVAGGLGGVVMAFHRGPLDMKMVLHGLEHAYASNFHAPNITGFSYGHEDYEELKRRLMAAGAKVRDVQNLKFPPHGRHVQEAEEKLAKLFKSRRNGGGIVVRDAVIPIIATRTAKAMSKARVIRHNIIWQTTQPTRLNDGVNFAVENGVEEFYDLGPGDSMAKLLGNIITGENVRIIPVGNQAG